MSVLRVPIRVILMLSALTQLAVTIAPVQWVMLEMEQAVVCMKTFTHISHCSVVVFFKYETYEGYR